MWRWRRCSRHWEPVRLDLRGGVLLMKFMKSDSSKGTRRAVSEHASLNWGSDGLSEGYAGMTGGRRRGHLPRTMFKTLGDLKGWCWTCRAARRFTEALRMGVAGVVAVDLVPKMLELTMERCKAAASSEAEGREHYNRGCASLRRTRASPW